MFSLFNPCGIYISLVFNSYSLQTDWFMINFIFFFPSSIDCMQQNGRHDDNVTWVGKSGLRLTMSVQGYWREKLRTTPVWQLSSGCAGAGSHLKFNKTVSTYKVTIRRVRVTIVAVEEQRVLNIMSVCLCSCVSHVYTQHIHIISQTVKFSGGKKILGKTCFLSTNYAWNTDVCMTAHQWYNNINNQLHATITVY